MAQSMDLPPDPISLKVKEDLVVRNYQHELAAPGIKGRNYIFIAPPQSGRTVVSALIISDHLQKHQMKSPCHVVFIVNTRERAAQKKEKLSKYIPGAIIEIIMGRMDGTIAGLIQGNNHISVCTSEKVLDEIQRGGIKFDQISLMVFDECHHAQKKEPYARLMVKYLEHKEDGCSMPQVIGMTATGLLLEMTTYLMNLAATMDAVDGFHKVTDNVEELQGITNSHEYWGSFNMLIDKIQENPDFKQELTDIQENLLIQCHLDATMNEERISRYESKAVKLFCKNCRNFACFGSDIRTLGKKILQHVVISADFRDKISCTPHPDHDPDDPKPFFVGEDYKVIKMHKISCINCGENWGNQLTKIPDGSMHPVIKCDSFTFETEDMTLCGPIKKWKKVPFKIEKLDEDATE